jgi:hypothetical protein
MLIRGPKQLFPRSSDPTLRHTFACAGAPVFSSLLVSSEP